MIKKMNSTKKIIPETTKIIVNFQIARYASQKTKNANFH